MKPIQCQHGFWVLEGDNWISKWAIESGRLDHDQYLLPQVLPYIKEGDHVIDFGCYIGDHTIAYANKVGPTGKIVAVDANEMACECCVKNVPNTVMGDCYGWPDGSERRNCVLHAFVSDKVSDGAFLDVDERNCGACKIADKDFNGSVGKMVRSLTIDWIAITMLEGKVDFIKMDVEGYEVFALHGGLATIPCCRPTMLIEVNRGALQRHKMDYETIVAALQDYNYTYYQIPNGKMTDAQYDLLCIPSERK